MTLQHYLGHSINAPTGRWQKNKDVHWYGRDTQAGDAERDEEIRKIKEAEAEALSIALYVSCAYILQPRLTHLGFRGFGPTGANATQPSANSSAGPSTTGAAAPNTEDDAARKLEKEERRRRKAERKEEKRARKEARRATRGDQDDQACRRERDQSRSPNRRRLGDEDRRSQSPTRDREERLSRLRDYDETERENERERHRRLWDMNAARYNAR